MAKSKQKAVKTPKKRSTKYGKLAAVCSKELAAKKAALVRAEKAFAKAQKNHTELLAEVARLDMLDRSLKALINGTEPPQNVRYVYSYPQWVWYGNPYGWWWNGNTWTVNLGATSSPSYTYGNFQGGQQQITTNAINTITTTPSITSYTATTGNLSLANASSGSSLALSNVSSGSSLDSVSCFNSGGLSNAVYNTSGTLPTATFTTTSSSDPELTVDLSTGALDEAAEKSIREGIDFGRSCEDTAIAEGQRKLREAIDFERSAEDTALAEAKKSAGK